MNVKDAERNGLATIDALFQQFHRQTEENHEQQQSECRDSDQRFEPGS